MATMEIDAPFWLGKRVLITGHTGFKGSWLSAVLNALGAVTTGVSLRTPTACLLDGVRWVNSEVQGDIVDHPVLGEAMREAEPEVVFHLAAQSLVSDGYRYPFETWRTNVLGTARVLEALNPQVKATVVVTSDKCYKPSDSGHPRYPETSPLGGDDPYSASKAAAELVVNSFRSGLLDPEQGVATARAGNVLGGADWSTDRLLPDCIRAFIGGSAVVLRRPEAVRPWQHVLEPIVGYLKLAEGLYHGDPVFRSAWNFGPSSASELDVYTVAEEAARLWGDGASARIDTSQATFGESEELRIDSTKAEELLSWSPLWDIGEALQATVSWYKNWHNGGDAKSITDKQVQVYLRKITM